MSLSITIQTVIYIWAIWAISAVLKLVAGAIIKVLSGEAPPPKPSVRLCASCTHPHRILSFGNATFHKLKHVLWLGFLIVDFSLMFLIVLLKFISLLALEFLKCLPIKLSLTLSN